MVILTVLKDGTDLIEFHNFSSIIEIIYLHNFNS